MQRIPNSEKLFGLTLVFLKNVSHNRVERLASLLFWIGVGQIYSDKNVSLLIRSTVFEFSSLHSQETRSNEGISAKNLVKQKSASHVQIILVLIFYC